MINLSHDAEGVLQKMPERFTDRARKCFAIAIQEAGKLNHQTLSTEHILLGLIKEANGVAANVLKWQNINFEQVLLKVHEYLKPETDLVTMGKLPQSESLKKAVENSILSAKEMGHRYVGTEHLLIGLLANPEDNAAKILASLGCEISRIKQEIIDLLGPINNKQIDGAQPTEGQEVPLCLSRDLLRKIHLAALDRAAAIENDDLLKFAFLRLASDASVLESYSCTGATLREIA